MGVSHYLDTSVIVALLREDAHTQTAIAWMRRLKPNCFVSDFCALEFSSVTSRHVRMGYLTPDGGQAALSLYDDWCDHAVQPIRSLSEDIELATQMVRDFESKLRAPDAIHVAIAKRNNLVLATFDKNLAEAARRFNVTSVIPD